MLSYQETQLQQTLDEQSKVERLWAYRNFRSPDVENCKSLDVISSQYLDAFKQNQITVFETRFTDCVHHESTVPFGYDAYYESKIEFLISKYDYDVIQDRFIPTLGDLRAG